MKQWLCCSDPVKTTKMTKMVGVGAGKGMVYQRHGLPVRDMQSPSKNQNLQIPKFSVRTVQTKTKVGDFHIFSIFSLVFSVLRCILGCIFGIKGFVWCTGPHDADVKERPPGPWIDSACADCPGFLIPGAAGAQPPELHPGASDCAYELAFAFMVLRTNSWICCCQLPYHPCKNRTHSTSFCGTRAHTPNKGPRRWGAAHRERFHGPCHTHAT